MPKDPFYPEAMEDAVQLSLDETVIAVSDGASESFDSRTWAQLLVNAYIKSPVLEPNWLLDASQKYNEQFELSKLSWSKQAAFERGSFATLLGIKTSCSNIDVFSVGDSLAVLLEGNEFVDSYPYTEYQSFQERPELFCTNNYYNVFFSALDFSSLHYKCWCIKQLRQPTLLCMTDALGEWALKMHQEGTPKWDILLAISDIEQLNSLVMRERETRSMRVDDVTLVTLKFCGLVTDELPDT